MGETTVKIKCTDQKLEAIEAPIIASGGFNENKVHFEFCPLWDGFTKTATFYVKKNEVYTAAVDSNGTCIVPHEVTENPGNMFFGVFGVKDDGTTRTSEVIKYKIVQGAITEDAKPSDPTPDIYEQILAKMATLDTHGHTIADVDGLQVELDGKSENGAEETDSSVAYVKSVPSNAANYAKVNKIGGVTRKCTNLFAYNTFVANGYTTRFNVKPGEVLYCAEVIDFPMQWGVYDVNGALIGTFYDLGFTNSSPLTVPSNASYVEVKAYGGQQGTYTQEGVCVGIPNADSEHILLLNDECYGVIHKGDIVKIGAGYYTVIEDAPAGDAEIEIRISPALADPDINGEAYLATANEVQAAMQKYASLYIGYEPYSGGLRSAPVTEVESVGVNLFKAEFGGEGYTLSGYGDALEAVDANTISYIPKNGQGADYIRFAQKYTSGVYTLSNKGKAPRQMFWLYDAFGNNISAQYQFSFGATYNAYYEGFFSEVDKLVITVPDGVSFWRYGVFFQVDNNNKVTISEIQVSKGENTPYRPYTHNTILIPEAVQSLDGYGEGVNESVYNYIDLDAKQFVKRVGVVDLGTLNWTKYQDDGIYYAPLAGGIFYGDNRVGNALCAKYNTTNNAMVNDGVLAFGGTFIGGGICPVVIHDRSYAGSAAGVFKTAMSGVMLHYELATPEIIDISIGDTLPVEAGGTVTMVNEYGYDVPSSITFYTNANDSYLGAKGFVGNLIGTAARAECDSDGNSIPETYATKKELKAHTHSFNDLADKPEITTYTLSKDGNLVILKGSDGSASSVVDATETGSAGGTTFTLVKRGNKISLEGSDGSYSEVEDDNTTYTKEQLGLGNVDNTADANKHVAFSKYLDINNMSNQDLNTITISGYYKGYTGMTNAPVQDIAVLEVLAYSPDWIIQRFTPIKSGKVVTYERRRHSGNTWSEWKRNIDSDNIDSQSVESATKATQDGNGNNIAETYATKGEVIGGTVVDITSSVSVSGSMGENRIAKAVDTGSSVMILFDGEQEFMDISLTVPSNLQSKLVVSAALDGASLPLSTEGMIGAELGSFYSTFCGNGTSLEIKYM